MVFYSFIFLALFLGNWKVLKSWTQVIWYGASLAKTLVVISGQNFSCHFCDSKGRPQVSRLGFLEQLELTLKVRHPIWILYWKSFFSKAQEVCTGNLDQACRFGYMDLV